MKTRITEMLGVRYPIIQGDMAQVTEYNLTTAMSEAGGSGLIGSANAPGEVVRDEIRRTKKLTSKPFGVNVMLLSPYADDVTKVIVGEGIKVITAGTGNPEKYMEVQETAGTKVILVVVNVTLARHMERYGTDAVVAKDMGSGGHVGEQTTITLAPQVADAVSVPVITADDVGDGGEMTAAFTLGAEAVQVGIRFVIAKGSIVRENYEQHIVKAKDIDSVVTGCNHDHPIRGLRNQVTREYVKLKQEDRSFGELEYLTLGTLCKVVIEGNVDDGAAITGQIAGMISKEQTCEEMIGEVMAQVGKLIHQNQGLGTQTPD